MLTLSGKPGDQFAVGNDVVVTFLGSNHKGECLIGFEAPIQVPINQLGTMQGFKSRSRYRQDKKRQATSPVSVNRETRSETRFSTAAD